MKHNAHTDQTQIFLDKKCIQGFLDLLLLPSERGNKLKE